MSSRFSKYFRTCQSFRADTLAWLELFGVTCGFCDCAVQTQGDATPLAFVQAQMNPNQPITQATNQPTN